METQDPTQQGEQLAVTVYGQNLNAPAILAEHQATNPPQPVYNETEEASPAEMHETTGQTALKPNSIRVHWNSILHRAEQHDEAGMLKTQLRFLFSRLRDEDPPYADCELYWSGETETIKVHRVILSRVAAFKDIDLEHRILVPSHLGYEAVMRALRVIYLFGTGGDENQTACFDGEPRDGEPREVSDQELERLDEFFGPDWASTLLPLEEHLASFYRSERYADATLVGCEEEEAGEGEGLGMPLHAAVVCGVEFFRAVLKADSAFKRTVAGRRVVELSARSVHISADAVLAVIRFLYDNDARPLLLPSAAQPCLTAATHLLIPPVKAVTAAEVATAVLDGGVGAEHLPSLLQQAEEVDHWGLRCACIQMMIERWAEVEPLEDYKTLPAIIKEEVELLVRRRSAGAHSSNPLHLGVCSAVEFLSIVAENLEAQRDRLREARERRGRCLYIGERLHAQREREIDDTAKVEEALQQQERRLESMQAFLDRYKQLRRKRTQGRAE